MNISAKKRLNRGSALPITLSITTAMPLPAQFVVAKDCMKI
jgi:hypothetical protein